jgi:hypothetical protein
MLAAMIELRVIVPPAYQGWRSLASAAFRASKQAPDTRGVAEDFIKDEPD